MLTQAVLVRLVLCVDEQLDPLHALGTAARSSSNHHQQQGSIRIAQGCLSVGNPLAWTGEQLCSRRNVVIVEAMHGMDWAVYSSPSHIHNGSGLRYALCACTAAHCCAV